MQPAATNHRPRRARTYTAVPVVLLAALMILAACESDAGEDPGDSLLTAEDVGGGATPIETPEDYLTETDDPCRIDPPSLFPGMTEDTTAVYQRDVDGGTETILVGAWRQDYDSYDRATDEFPSTFLDYDIPGCETAKSDRAGIGDIQLVNAIAQRVTFYQGTTPESGIEKVATKAYAWGDGHVIATWVTRNGGDSPDSVEVGKLMIKQIEKLDLDTRNDLP